MTDEIKVEEKPKKKKSSFDANDVATIAKSKDTKTFSTAYPEIAGFLTGLGYTEQKTDADFSTEPNGVKQYGYIISSEKKDFEGFDFIGMDYGIFIYRKC